MTSMLRTKTFKFLHQVGLVAVHLELARRHGTGWRGVFAMIARHVSGEALSTKSGDASAAEDTSRTSTSSPCW
jgi:hypothetical protein